MSRQWHGRLVRGVLAAALTTCLLGGCAATSTDLNATTSTGMQATVKTVAETAAAGDYAAAVTRLGELQTQLDQAVAGDGISAARAQKIQSSIDLVKADLVALVDAQTVTPSPNPSPGPQPAGPGKTDKPGKPDKPGKGGK